MTAALLVIAIAVGIALVGYQFYRAKKRREAFQSWAAGHGWTYTQQDDSFTERFHGTPFDQGDHRRAKNVVQGQLDGRPIVAFDYSFQTHSTDSNGNTTTQTHYFSVVATGLAASLPRLQVTKEGLFGSLGRALGFHDIELENEEFNKRFKVKCEDRKFAYDVLHPRMMQMLLAADGPAWRIDHTDLIAWDKGKLAPAVIEAQLRFLDAIADQVPRFVWEDRK